MGIIELLIIALSLSMDAFAVAVCKGLANKTVRKRELIITGLWFGGFQALMPTIGYLLGKQFEQYITAVDHWIAFLLLGLIGGNMIKEALSKEEESVNASFCCKAMFPLAIATSIDALAVGVTFAFLKVNILLAVLLIGITTFLCSAAGVKIGNVFGAKYKSKAELAGGIVLVLMGLKILIEHLFEL